METNIQVVGSESLAAITRSEIDAQVATAKSYPRDPKAALEEIKMLAASDEETAATCFYSLKRGDTAIEGISVRLAEIVAYAWGNLRVDSYITANDGKTITAQAVCHDLERNTAIRTEVKRRITDKHGKTYSEDMQVVTGNAACSIAFRNAVMKVIPGAYLKRVLEQVKQVSIGNANNLDEARAKSIAWFAKIGITETQLLQYLEVDHRDAIDAEKLQELRGLATAIREGSTTKEEAILAVLNEREKETAAAQAQQSAKDKVMAAMKK